MNLIDIVDELRGFAGGSDSARATLMRDAADEIERLRGDTEWEYGNALINKDGYPTGLVMPAREGEAGGWGLRIVRRRKAGPWEPVEGETGE